MPVRASLSRTRRAVAVPSALSQSALVRAKRIIKRRWFIRSLCARATPFACGWRPSIENPLHWVKDGVLHEDRSLLRHSNVAINTSCRNLVINLLGLSGFASITQGLRAVAHEIEQLLLLAQSISPAHQRRI